MPWQFRLFGLHASRSTWAGDMRFPANQGGPQRYLVEVSPHLDVLPNGDFMVGFRECSAGLSTANLAFLEDIRSGRHRPQHRLNLMPLPQKHLSLRPGIFPSPLIEMESRRRAHRITLAAGRRFRNSAAIFRMYGST